MKKIIGLSIVLLLFLAGCSTTSPEAAFETAKDKVEDSAQTIDFVVASVMTTEDGEVPFDNMGTISKEASEEFVGMVEAKTEIDSNYEDVIVYAPEGKFVMELNDTQTTASLEEIIADLKIVNFTKVNELIKDYDDLSSEGNVHTYTKESDDLDDILDFSNHGHLLDLEFKSGSMKQTLVINKDVLQENQIYIDSVYIDEDGTEYPVTQNINLKYTEGAEIAFPEFD